MARGNLYEAVSAQTGTANLVWLAHDNISEARKQAQQAKDNWSQKGVHLQHLFNCIAETNISIYVGKASAAMHSI